MMQVKNFQVDMDLRLSTKSIWKVAFKTPAIFSRPEFVNRLSQNTVKSLM